MTMQLESTKRRHVTCGCCSTGCVCKNHEDAPNGSPARMCVYCSQLAFAPLDADYRYDPQERQFVRKPQGAMPLNVWERAAIDAQLRRQQEDRDERDRAIMERDRRGYGIVTRDGMGRWVVR